MELHLKIIQIHTELATTIIVKPPARQHFPLLFRRKTSVGASSCPKYWRLTLNCGTLLTGIAHTSFFLCGVPSNLFLWSGFWERSLPVQRTNKQSMTNSITGFKNNPFGVFDYWAKSSCFLLDAKSQIVGLKGGSLAKSRKLFFQGRSFLEGKIQKMQKKISKNFIVPNHLLGHIDHLYTYKRHIKHVGLT